MTDILQLSFNGIAIGSIYALIALGFIFAVNSVKIVNLAHGEILMLGGYFAVTTVLYLKMPVLLGCLVAIIGTVIFGYILNLAILRPLVGKPFFSVVVATLGLSMILSNTAMNIWGPNPINVPGPFEVEVFLIGGVVIAKLNLLVIATLAVVLVLLAWFYQKTLTGRQMRAMSELPDVARLLGLPVRRLTALTFMVSAGLAGLSGVLVGPLYFVSPHMGGVALLKGFTAAIIGGFGKVEGAVLGGLALGIIETMMASYVSPIFKDGFSFMVLILVLLIRPMGILGESFSKRV